jgi:hypothetical protein
MKKEVRSFYRDFYSIDDAAYAKIVAPYLRGDLR